MNKIPIKTKLIAASIGLLIAIVLVIGGSFAWLILNKQPEVKKMNVNVSNDTILEIAQAYPENYLTGPPEVGENDNAKTRTVDGKTVADQGVWGKLVDMSGNQIILQEPATYDEQTKTLSTAKFDKTGRTEGLMALTKQDIDDHGLVYYTKGVTEGNYRGEDGKIHAATASQAQNVKCAGGISLWLRSNKPTSEEVFLKGLTLTKAAQSGEGTEEITDDDFLGVIVTTYHLKKDAATKALEKKDGILREGTLEPFNNYYATKTDNGYVCTLFAGSEAQQMQPGELYLLEIICYIEGNKDNSQGNTAAVSSNTGETRKVSFDKIECQDVLYAAKVTEENNTPRNSGWFSGHVKLKIELFGTSDKVENKNIIISYKLTPYEDKETVLKSGQFMAFDANGNKNSEYIELDDGIYSLTVMTTLTDENGNVDPKAQKYYTVSISDTSMVNTVEDSITVRVDTIKPVVSVALANCGCAYEEKGVVYHNHDVTVNATAVEQNISSFKIGGRKITPEPVLGQVDTYKAERLYVQDGSYNVDVVVTDRSGKPNDTKDASGNIINQKSFIIDQTLPKITSVEWGFVNDNGIASLFSKLTGETSFNERVQLKIVAQDDNILSMECSDKQGIIQPYDVDVVKDGTSGKRMIATVTLPKLYQGKIIVKVKDKAGNVLTQETEEIIINDRLPSVTETHTGTKAGGSTSDSIWYDITYKLTASGLNPESAIGFEYSNDGNHWYQTNQHIGDVYYEVYTDQLSGDTVTIYTDNVEGVNGEIFFRPLTNITGTSTGGETKYLPGIMMGKSYKLKAHTPETPKVEATYYDRHTNKNQPYIEGTPIAGEIEYNISSPSTEDLIIEGYEYSLDGDEWYTSEMYFGDLEVYCWRRGLKIGINSQYDCDVSGEIRFRAYAYHNELGTVYGEPTEPYEFEVDNKIPIISEPVWDVVNSDAISSILNTLTGQNFFNTYIKVSATATDENIESLTCTKGDCVQEESEGSITTSTYLDPDYVGELYFEATDAAGNTNSVRTKNFRENNLKVKDYGVSIVKTDESPSGAKYQIGVVGDDSKNVDYFEFSLDKGTTWNNSTFEDDKISAELVRKSKKSTYAYAYVYNKTNDKQSGHIRFRAAIKTGEDQFEYIEDGTDYDFELLYTSQLDVKFDAADSDTYVSDEEGMLYTNGDVILSINEKSTSSGISLQKFDYYIDASYSLQNEINDCIKVIKNDGTGFELRIDGSKLESAKLAPAEFDIEVGAIYSVDGTDETIGDEACYRICKIDRIDPNIYLSDVESDADATYYSVAVQDNGQPTFGDDTVMVTCNGTEIQWSDTIGDFDVYDISVPNDNKDDLVFTVKDLCGNSENLKVSGNSNEYIKAATLNRYYSMPSYTIYKLSAIDNNGEDVDVDYYQYSLDSKTWYDASTDKNGIRFEPYQYVVFGDRIDISNMGNATHDGKIYFRGVVKTGNSVRYITDPNEYHFRLAASK